MTSTESMSSAGMACSAGPRLSPCSMAEGLPSTRIWTLVLPRSETVPSGSTDTDGTLPSASAALPLELLTSLLTS